MANKLWCVKLIRPVKGNRLPIQELCTELGLTVQYKPAIVPNTPHFNSQLHKIQHLVHVQPLVIAPNPYPFADHPFLAPNGVFYPSADKLETIHKKYGNTASVIDFPGTTHKAVKRDILDKYQAIFEK
eukprot:sb/3475420/